MMNPLGAAMGTSLTTGSLGGSLGFWNMAAWQQDMINSNHATLLTIFVIVAAVALFAQAVVLIGVAVGAYKAQQKIEGHVLEIKGKLMPLIETSHGLVKDLTPEIRAVAAKVNLITGKVHEISGHVEKMTAVAKEKVDEFSPTISDINAKVKQAVANADVTVQAANETVRTANEKTREQVARVNGMVTSALDATERMGKAIAHGITQPGREIAGLVGGARATIDHLMKTSGAGAGSGVASVLSKVSSLFAKQVGPAIRAAAAKPAAATSKPAGAPAAAGVKPFGSMSGMQASGMQASGGEMTPGVSSGSGTNGDPILS